MGHSSTILDNRKLSILKYIVDYNSSVGYSPTVREICIGVNLKSSSTVHAHLNKLEYLGYITKNIDIPRSIVVTDKYFSLYTDVECNNNEDIHSSLKNITDLFTSEESIYDEEKDIYKLEDHRAVALYTKLNDSFNYIKEKIVTEPQFRAASKISVKISLSCLMLYLDMSDSRSIGIIESQLASVISTINEYSDKKISYGEIDYMDKNPSVEFFWHINSRKPSGISIIF